MPSTVPGKETDETTMQEIFESAAQLDASNEYFQNRYYNMLKDITSEMHLDPAQLYLIRLIVAQQVELSPMTHLTEQQKRDLLTAINTKTNELVYATREMVVKELARVPDNLAPMFEQINKRKEQVVQLEQDIKELQTTLEKLQNEAMALDI